MMSSSWDSEDGVIILGGLVAGGIVIATVALVALSGAPTSGTHTGIITAVEERGIIWTTGTAYVKTGGEASQEEEYCVQDPTVFDALKAAASSRALVEVKFLRDSVIVPPWQCHGEAATIYAVTAIPERGPQP